MIPRHWLVQMKPDFWSQVKLFDKENKKSELVTLEEIVGLEVSMANPQEG